MKTSKVPAGQELALTTVKILPVIYERFQRQSLNSLTFQKLVNRALDLYVNDPEFRKLISSHTALIPSGSL